MGSQQGTQPTSQAAVAIMMIPGKRRGPSGPLMKYNDGQGDADCGQAEAIADGGISVVDVLDATCGV